MADGPKIGDLWGKPIKNSFSDLETNTPQLYLGQVEGVDEARGTAFVRCATVNKTFEEVPICQPYMHPGSDEGIHFVPRIGSWAIIAIVERQPFLLPSYFSPPEPTTRTYWGFTRTDAHQGDSWISSQDGHHLSVMSGTIHHFFNGGFLQMIWNGYAERLKQIFRRWVTQTDAGVEEHDSDEDKAWIRKEYTVKPAKPTLYRFRINTKEHMKLEIYDQKGETFYGYVHWKPDGNIFIKLDHEKVEVETLGRHFYTCEAGEQITITGKGGDHNGDCDPRWVARVTDHLDGYTDPAGDGHTHKLSDKAWIAESGGSRTMKTT